MKIFKIMSFQSFNIAGINITQGVPESFFYLVISRSNKYQHFIAFLNPTTFVSNIF